MRRWLVATFLTLSPLVTPLVSAEINDLYHDLFGTLDAYVDPNAGLTVFPSLLIPAGGRLEGMGTAFTAVADDSGFIEANPAASASLAKTELSILHNNWIEDTRLESVVYTRRFDQLGLAAAAKVLYLPFTHYDVWGERAASAHLSESVATLNASYNLFSSYDFFGLSVGTNLKLAYRSVPAQLAAGQSAVGVMADFGVLTRFNLLKAYHSRERNFSLGTALKNLGPLSDGEPLPTHWTTGIAFSPVRPVLIAFDFTLPISLYPATFPAEQWFVAGGVDVALTNFLSLHTGFHFKSASPRLSLGSSLELEEISFVANYVLDLTGDPKFSIEAKLDLGDDGRADKRAQVDELYVAGLNAYATGQSERAIELWEQALTIDPRFSPARANLELVRELLQLQQTMGQIQSGE